MKTPLHLCIAIDQVMSSLLAFWRARNRREQAYLATTAGIFAVVLIYALLIGPALSGRDQLVKSLPLLRQQMAQMQDMARELSTLTGTQAALPVDVSRESIEATLAHQGLRAQSVTLNGDLVRLQLSKASFSDLTAWLNDMQRDAYLVVVDAAFAANGDIDSVDAELTLRNQEGKT